MVCVWVAFHENDRNHENEENDQHDSDSYEQGVECWISGNHGNHGNDENHWNPGRKPRVPKPQVKKYPSQWYVHTHIYMAITSISGPKKGQNVTFCQRTTPELPWLKMHHGKVMHLQEAAATQHNDNNGGNDNRLDHSDQ